MELARQLLLAHAFAPSQALGQAVESGHLAASQRRLLPGGLASQGPVEGGVGVEGPGQVQDAGDPGERTALLTEEQGLFVACSVIRHRVVPGFGAGVDRGV